MFDFELSGPKPNGSNIFLTTGCELNISEEHTFLNGSTCGHSLVVVLQIKISVQFTKTYIPDNKG